MNAFSETLPVCPVTHSTDRVGEWVVGRVGAGRVRDMRAFSDGLDAAEGTPLFSPHGKGDECAEKDAEDSLLQRKFRCAARLIASHPWAIIALCYVVCAACTTGMLALDITSDPEKIWVPPGSSSAVQEQFFNNYFSPFFRTEVMIFSTPNRTVNMIDKGYLERVMAVQSAINATRSSKGAVLNDLCFKPIMGKGCMIASPMNYWRDDLALLEVCARVGKFDLICF